MKKTLILIGVAVLIAAAFGFRNEISAALPVNTEVRAFFLQLDQRGATIQDSMPKSYARFSSTTEAVICTGKCLIYDVIMASGADGAYAILSDTIAVNGTGDKIFAKAEFDGTGIPKSYFGASKGVPFMTERGLALDLSSVGAGEELLILFQDLD